MACIAALVREMNDRLFAPDAEFGCDSALLVNEPPLRDAHELPDGRTWVRVYLDGSALDHRGLVWRYAPWAADRLRGTEFLPLAA